MDSKTLDFAYLIGKKYDGEVQGTESLLHHSLAVANEARRQARLCLNPGKTFKPYLEEMAWLCGFFHDLGKCTQQFQNSLSGSDHSDERNGNTSSSESCEGFHNIAGAIIFHNLVKVSVVDDFHYLSGHKETITRSILYHHPLPYIRKGKNARASLSIRWDKRYEDLVKYMVELANENLQHIKLTFLDIHRHPIFGDDREVRHLYIDKDEVPYYSTNPDDYNNLFNFTLDQIVKMSDVVMSMPTAHQKLTYFNKLHYRSVNIDPAEIIRPADYDSRYELQCEYADKLSEHKMSLFEASPGFGKTGTGLHYILSQKNNNEKAFWVCPRNTIAVAVYETLKDEIKARQLTDKVSVGLLLTNKWLEGDEKSDIIVTNIDNFCRPVFKNDAIKRTFNMLNAICVFDEFHEYFGGGSSLMAMFDIILKSREFTNSKTLLLSATPCKYFYTIGNKNSEVHQEKYEDPRIGDRTYKVEYSKSELPNFKNTLHQVYSRRIAQTLSIQGLGDDIYHSCFLPSDKKSRFAKIQEEHGKDKTNPDVSYVTTNIIGTGVDVNFKNLVVNLPSPDSLIQALGRCNRWCDAEDYSLAISNNRYQSEVQTIKSIFGSTDTHFGFYEYLKENLPAGNHTFAEICSVREGYMKEHHEDLRKLFTKALVQSCGRLCDFDYEYVPTGENTEEKFVGGNVLRSDGITNNFWCQFYGFGGYKSDELFCADTRLVNLLRGRNREEVREIVDFHMKRTKSNITRAEERKMRNMTYESLIDYLIKKARSDKYPFHISPRFYVYSPKYGLMTANSDDYKTN